MFATIFFEGLIFLPRNEMKMPFHYLVATSNNAEMIAPNDNDNARGQESAAILSALQQRNMNGIRN